MTNAVDDYWNESQSVNDSLNATIFHYGLAIKTESYKIDKIHEFKTCGLTGC